MFKSKKLNLLVLMFGIVVLAFVFNISNVKAGVLVNTFAGRVVSKVPCTCSVGSQITIKGGRFSGTYLELPSSRVYMRSFVSPGRNVIGSYTPGGQCLVTASPCTVLPITRGTINTVGTSF